jgi:hypothetical protein
MLLIYTHKDAPRLRYITRYIFSVLLPVEAELTTDTTVFSQYEGPKINYSDTPLPGEALHIRPVSLLFETGIRQQDITITQREHYPYFFETSTDSMFFDVFAAAFYLISRYEEYLPAETDSFGRFAHTNSLAWKADWLKRPWVHYWTLLLHIQLKKRFPNIGIGATQFSFVPTYDIDIAFSYRCKGALRSLAGMLLDPNYLIRRVSVLLGKEKDPFDSYDWLHELHQRYNLSPVYFFHLGATNGKYDRQILPHHEALQTLVADHARQYKTGIHPSWKSGDDPALLTGEIEQLRSITKAPVTQSRQHYIRMQLPQTYRRLLEAGITDDYSMGYGSINGYRASVATPFYWYDVEADTETALRVHPFCCMDANCRYEQYQSAEMALMEMQMYATECRMLRVPFTPIWHNNFLGTDPVFWGWRDAYEEFLKHSKCNGRVGLYNLSYC